MFGIDDVERVYRSRGCRYSDVWLFAGNAMKTRNMDILKWAIDKSDGQPYLPTLRDLAIRAPNVESIEYLASRGLVLDNDLALVALIEERADVLEWFCAKGVIPCIHPCLDYLRWSKGIMRILHQYDVPGRYKAMCSNGICCICKRLMIAESWEMDEVEYKNMVQWLPRELMEDVNALV